MPTLAPQQRFLAAICLALTSCAAASGQTAAPDLLNERQVCELRSVAGAVIAPDGQRAAFTRSMPRKAGEDDDGAAWTELWVYDLATGRERPFVTGKVNVSGVQWAPDGKSIAFLAKRGEDKFNALYLIPIDGGEARRALSLGDSIGAYSFAPDGKRVAAVAADADKPETKKAREKGFAQEIYEEDWRYQRLWIAKLDDSADKPRKLELKSSAHAVEWSPIDERVAVSLTPTPGVDDEYMQQRVVVLDVKSGDVLARVENPGKLGAFRWSPDGKWLALLSAADQHDPSAGRLMVAAASGGAPIDVLPDYPGDAGSFAWRDATHLLYTASQGVFSVLERVEISAQGKGSGIKVLLTPGGPILGGLSLSKDGQRAVFTGSTPANPPELYSMNHGEPAPTRRTDSNPWLAEMRLAPQEVVKFKARDGVEIEGLLNRPLNEIKGQRYPLILVVHGGPEAHHSNGWLSSYGDPAQLGPARGFAVMHTNYRGSTGRGVEFSKLSQGDPGGKEFDDLVDAVDHLIGTGLVDRDRVGVTGGSYGGYATAWLSTKHSSRFAAGVMFVGISDKISKVGTTDIPNEEYLVHALHRPWEDWNLLLERSPIFHAGNCRTPLLILHGKDDPRVNPGQSRELYRHLKLRGQAPVRLVMYPGEGHGNRKAAARFDYCLRSMQWFEHYLKGPGGEMPDFELQYAGLAAKTETSPEPLQSLGYSSP